MRDSLLIQGIRVAARVGVPDIERRVPQRIEVDIALESDFRGIDDDISKTTNYAELTSWVRARCGAKSYRLIESLADELARGILADFPKVFSVRIGIRKFVLAEVGRVEVGVHRTRQVEG